MATMNDFRGEAQTQNQGWYNAERINRDANVNTAQEGLNRIDPYYQTLFDELAGNQKKSQDALTASSIRRGVFRSGVQTKAESNLSSEYGKLNTRLGEEKRQKVTDTTSALNTAKSLRGNLDSEFESKVSALARELFNSWQSIEASKASSYSGGATTKAAQADPIDLLWADAEAYAKGGVHASTQGHTEQSFIPAMLAKYAKYGLTQDQIADIVYTARKPYEGKSNNRAKATNAINSLITRR